MLGDDGFAELAGAYLSEHPSKKPSIRWFGATLHDFVAQHPDVLPHPALQDLIQMEWALSIAFDSADVALLPAGALLAVPADVWPVLRFTPQPALQLFAVGWNIEILWSALSADQDAETEAPVALDHHLLVWRVEHATRWRSVQQTEAALLQAAVAGADFARLCVLAQETSGDLAAQHVAGYLRLWLDAGLFCGFSQALRNEPDNLGIA